MDTQPQEGEPRLLTKDQLVELLLYVAFAAVGGAAISSGWGMLGAILGLLIVAAAIFAISVAFVVSVNFVQRYYWRRRHRHDFVETTGEGSGN